MCVCVFVCACACVCKRAYVRVSLCPSLPSSLPSSRPLSFPLCLCKGLTSLPPLSSQLPGEFDPSIRKPTRVPGDTFYLLHAKMTNYYHTIVEVLTRSACF